MSTWHHTADKPQTECPQCLTEDKNLEPTFTRVPSCCARHAQSLVHHRFEVGCVEAIQVFERRLAILHLG
jgi:hypothetical protein